MVLSADAVYVQDYRELIREHMASEAAVTMVTTEVAPDDADRYGVVQTEGGRITDYEYKPDEPQTSLVANEVFVFRPDPLLAALEELADAAGDDDLEDLGNEVLPRLVQDGGAREARFGGYWRDVGTVDAYWQAHMDLLEDAPPIDLDDPRWPVLTQAVGHRGAARIRPGAAIEGGLIAPAATVAGTVERSIVSRGAVVEQGAHVRDSVLLPGAKIRAGARVERAIIDDDVEVGRDANIGKPGGELALVGLRATVEPAATLPAGARFPAT